MVSSNLVVPVVLWGPSAPTHCVSSVFLSEDHTTLATGCYDGQICLWHVEPQTLKMSPRCLLVGHSAPITCLVRASIIADNNFLVSSSENGEMCTWDLIDGKCAESVKLTQIHTHIQSYHTANSEDVRLFCIGYYPEIIVMDPFSLEIIYVLSSKVKPDWISAIHVLRPMRRKDDVVLAITTTGTVKVWTLIGNENKLTEPMYENESKEIRCLNAITMNCCAQNQRTVLIVCSKYWQIYDAGDFTVLCSVVVPNRERWQGGDFITSDRVILWTDDGKGYLYKLPGNCIPDNKEFHSKSIVRDIPYLYYILQQPGEKVLSCPPAMRLIKSEIYDKDVVSLLLRGDSEGYISVWTVPDVPLDNISILQAKQMPPRILKPTVCTSLVEAWSVMDPAPVGILDQLSRISEKPVKLTSSIYLPQQSRLVIGREDGCIVIVPATQTVMMQLLIGIKGNFDWPTHQLLHGHRGRVNCLLSPSLLHQRYEKSHLISGGVDFAVCLWDLYSGSLLHRFCVHAGEITQLLVPPDTCSPRILKCICSVASDHSVTLLSLQERKCITLASRHLFPVITIKWRPLDDFLIVGCSDGSVYVWQMETGHLDRVLHGMVSEEVLLACDEQTYDSNCPSAPNTELGMANPAVHFFRGLKSRNMNAIRHATQRGIHQLQQLQGHNQGSFDFLMKHRSNPLVIQGLRTNPKDAESHILFFDIEGLIFELHSEEYAKMSLTDLEALGVVFNHPKDKGLHLEASKKISDFFGKVKNKAGDMEKILKDKDKHKLVQKFKEKTEIVEKKVQAKVQESLQRVVVEPQDTGDDNVDLKSKIASKLEVTHVMEVSQLLLSLLHSWGLDPHLDKVCESQLGLLRPMVPISFGILSKGGYMSLLLPTWQNNFAISEDIIETSSSSIKKHNLPKELIRLEQLTAVFTSRLHWELSTTITSNHILAMVAMANTLLSMSSATFLSDSERTKKIMRLAQRSNSTLIIEEEREELLAHHTSQIKQGWSLLSTHHCFLLPDKIEALEPKKFKRPQVEMMAKRWQHHCIEIREAAQQILLGELRRMGKKGRKQLLENWAQYLPLYTHTESIVQYHNVQQQQQQYSNHTNGHINVNNMNVGTGIWHSTGANGGGSGGNGSSSISSNNGTNISVSNDQLDNDYEEEEEEEEIIRKPSSLSELKRKQTTAVILLGVIGAEFGQDIHQQDSPSRVINERRKSSCIEGFGIANNLARLTSMALAHLLYAPPSAKLPQYTPLRRAAIDLLGRGFIIWEPYLDVSKVLLGLLEIACEGKNVPNLNYKLPLTPQADACRTARHALRLIATARPAAFITTMAKEVARYNSMQQNPQSINIPLTQSVLHKAKGEILQCIEMLIDKMQAEIAGLLVEVMDITLHCIDNGELKNKGLNDLCPSVCRYNQISHCPQTRRIAVGASNGHLAIYELRQNKCQMIPAHTQPITSLAFSPDGKFLVSYSCCENRLSFWQTSSGMFGLGQSQTRCTKGYSTAPIPDISRYNPMRLARLVWINNRTVTLMLADGSETRFNI